MAWSSEQDERDQAAQSSWVDGWAGWAQMPEWVSGPGWNALHQEHGGGEYPGPAQVMWPAVPERFYGPWDPQTGGWPT